MNATIAMPAVAAIAAVTCLNLTGCTASKEDQLVEARRERRQLVDSLYAEYGGGKLAAEVKRETDREAAREQEPAGVELMKMMGNFAGEVDRTAFEVQCLTLGEGERPLIMNDKAKAFFSSSSTEKTCIKVAKLSRKIEQLEQELGVAPENGR